MSEAKRRSSRLPNGRQSPPLINICEIRVVTGLLERTTLFSLRSASCSRQVIPQQPTFPERWKYVIESSARNAQRFTFKTRNGSAIYSYLYESPNSRRTGNPSHYPGVIERRQSLIRWCAAYFAARGIEESIKNWAPLLIRCLLRLANWTRIRNNAKRYSALISSIQPA